VGRIHVIGIGLTGLIDGLAVIGIYWFAAQATNHFRETAGIRHKTTEQYLQRAHAWYIVVVIAVIGGLATVLTAWLLGAFLPLIWVILAFSFLGIIAAGNGKQLDEQAERERSRAD
jgi:hypothetical protein